MHQYQDLMRHLIDIQVVTNTDIKTDYAFEFLARTVRVITNSIVPSHRTSLGINGTTMEHLEQVPKRISY